MYDKTTHSKLPPKGRGEFLVAQSSNSNVNGPWNIDWKIIHPQTNYTDGQKYKQIKKVVGVVIDLLCATPI